MAFNKPIIAGLPTTPRTEIRSQPVPTRSTLPTESERVSNPDGTYTSKAPLIPTREGQMCVHTFVDTGLRAAQIYIAVDIEGTLTWKRVGNYNVINGYTGKPIDPLYDV